MIKVMIVDDEAYVREGIKKTIDWVALDMQPVAEASSFTQALELFNKFKPEIVITDIRMKSKSGLELIAEIKQQKPSTEIIIISGYDSFEYAHSALKQNVNFYLLKPISNTELTDALIACKNKLEEKKHVDVAIENYIQFQHKNFVFDILNDNNLTSDSLNHYCNAYNINLPSNLYMVAILKFTSEEYDDVNPMHRIMTNLRDTISYYISFSNIYTISAETYESVILVAFFRTDADDSKFNLLLENIKETVEVDTEKTLNIGKSGIFRNPVIIKRAYKQALHAVSVSEQDNAGHIVNYTYLNENSNAAKIDVAFIHQFLDALHQADKLKLQEMINRCFESTSIRSDDDLKKFKDSVLDLILAMLNEVIIDTNSMLLIFGKTLNPSFDIQNTDTMSQLKNNLLFIVNKLLASDEVRLLYHSRPMIKNAIVYIMKNYAKKIKVQDVSDEFFISPYHFMREFKKVTGRTFNAFLTEYRIKSAIALIQSGKYKVYEIGSLVGYVNPDYFYRVFKQITGHAPTYYCSDSDETS